MAMSNASQNHRGVTVGVDGSERGYVAVRYAAREAGRLGVPLDIVHAIAAYIPDAPGMTPMMPDPLFESYGAEILARARTVARGAVPTLVVETHLRLGHPAKQLLALTPGASLIVLGNRGPISLDRVWTGVTVTGVADRAPCPMIVVPADYEPDDVHRRILVGVQYPAAAAELFNRAFPLADALDAELVILHAWRLEGAYDDVIAERAISERQHERVELIEQELGGYRHAFPGVSVRVYIRHEDPAHALVRVTSGADRLLMLRATHDEVTTRLGRVARAVLRDARCPVEVVPARMGAGRMVSHTLTRTSELVP